MKKNNKRDPQSERLPVYDLKGRVQGKYASRMAKRADGSVAHLQLWAPLSDFPWSGKNHRITEHTWIRTASAYRGYKAEEVSQDLSAYDRLLCQEAEHWLSVGVSAQQQLSARESMNMFLLALWMIKPTKTHVALRFQESPAEPPSVFRVLDRFQWIEGQATDQLQDEDLDGVSSLLESIRYAYIRRGRLRNALVLTFRGCVSIDWQAAVICWSAALEALLTYDRGPGLTKRLARAYARLCQNPAEQPGKAGIEFTRAYDVRSDIMHGRSYDRDASAENLVDVAACSDLLRRAWRSILPSDELTRVLEADDKVRKQFFERSPD